MRLALAGYDVDVLPDLLHFYRQVEGSLARTLAPEMSSQRLLDAYEDGLKAIGLEGGAAALLGLYRSREGLLESVRHLSLKADHTAARFAFFTSSGRRFERDSAIERLRTAYRRLLPMEARLKIHRIFLAPIFGPFRPPPP